MARIPELAARTDGANHVFQISGDVSATVAWPAVPRYEAALAALHAGFARWAALTAKDAERLQPVAWNEASAEHVREHVRTAWLALQAAVQAGAREDAAAAAQPVPDGAHGAEDRAMLRSLSIPEQIRAVSDGDDDMLAALLHVGAARWNWPVEAWEAAVDRWHVAQILNRSGIPALFAVQPSLDDVAPIGVNWPAAEAAARVELDRDAARVAETAAAKRVLTDTVAAVAAGTGRPAADALTLLVGGRA